MSWTLKPTAELDEAITWFKKRTAIPSKDLAVMQESARRKGFWMAKVRTAQRAKRIQDSLEIALAHGMDFATWKKTNRGILQRISNAHLQTTFRNWNQTAYNAARVNYLSDPQVIKRRPYWMFDAVMDGRTTPICVASNRTVLRANHPWFKRHTPPLHHNCRSSIRGLTAFQANKIGIKQRGPNRLTKAKAAAAGLEPGKVAPEKGFGKHIDEPWTPSTKELPKGFKRPKRPEEIKS
jgi:hypothetical protein